MFSTIMSTIPVYESLDDGRMKLAVAYYDGGCDAITVTEINCNPD